MRAVLLSIVAIWAAGCRAAVVTAPKSERTQTVVTVEERPTTNPTDKGLIVRDKR
jgi:hypothetical protein